MEQGRHLCGGEPAAAAAGGSGDGGFRAGMASAKANVFDDFIAAAEYLIDRKYTARISWRSPAVRTAACSSAPAWCSGPTSLAVALPAVGGWTCCATISLPSVGAGSRYPAAATARPISNTCTVIRRCTISGRGRVIGYAGHDRRSRRPGGAAHSFKFAATLQAAQGATGRSDPIDTAAGHGLGKPTAKGSTNRRMCSFSCSGIPVRKNEQGSSGIVAGTSPLSFVSKSHHFDPKALNGERFFSDFIAFLKYLIAYQSFFDRHQRFPAQPLAGIADVGDRMLDGIGR